MGKTTQVASDRAYDKTKTVLPAEVARGVYIENPPSAQALKLMHLLIAEAGGRMAEPVQHDMRLSDLKRIEGMRNHTRASIKALFVQLRGSVIVYDDTETQAEVIGGFMDEIHLDYRHEVSDDLLIKWWFGRTFISMAADSNHWAVLDRQTIFALSSKYAILLYQHIASLTGLDHMSRKAFTVPELRAVLGVEEGKLARFSHLNSRAIQPAIAEINQLSRLTLTATSRKVGRTVASVEIAWEMKPDPTAARKELAASKVGRKVRREGTSETPAVAFPATGTLKGITPWDALAREHVTRIQGGHVPDLRGLSDAFRNWCEAKGIKLDARNIDKTFIGFCKSYRPII